MECEALFEVWGDRILKDYLWAIAGSFAHGNQGRQVALYTEAWCKFGWREYGTEIAFLMDEGFEIMYRYAFDRGWLRMDKRWSCQWCEPKRIVRRKLRFFLRHVRLEPTSLVE